MTMKTKSRSTELLTIVTALAAAAVIWTHWPASPVLAIQDSEDRPPPFGLAQGQTARLTLFNSGETAIVGPEYRFLDSRGNTLAQSTERIEILPGQFRSFDFDLPEPPPGISDPFGRIQVRAVVTSTGNPDEKDLRVSLEVFDNATGKTSFVIQPPPEPE
jgi:hypothetical protein